MKAFHFRLQTSLDVAQRRQKVAKEELQNQIIQRNMVLTQYDNAQKKREDLRDNIRGKGVPFRDYLVTTDYLHIMRAIINDLESALEAEEEKVEAARLALINYSKEKQTLEKVKERDWAEYLYEINREEQKEIDEVAINKVRLVQRGP